MTARVTRRWPRIGRAHEAWPGITISGVVIVAAAVIADALDGVDDVESGLVRVALSRATAHLRPQLR